MIDEKTIEHIAKLARLKISKTEAIDFNHQLTKILNHFNTLSEIDTHQVEPLITPLETSSLNFSYLRNDVAENLISTEDLLKNAPDKLGNLFKVPPVVG